VPSTAGVAESAGGVDDDAVSADAAVVVLASVDVPYTCASTGFARMNAATAKVSPMKTLRPTRWPKVSFMRSLYYLGVGSASPDLGISGAEHLHLFTEEDNNVLPSSKN
jgi:hypothetical protein